MDSVKFEWSNQKAASNIKQYGVSFEEAKTVFSDENARVIHDPDHSDNEDRFIILGISVAVRTLVVCHCYKDSDNVIRIISARKATKREAKQYRGEKT